MAEPGDTERNVELVRTAQEHFAATGELPTDVISDDFVWDMSRAFGWPEDQTYHGIEGANAFLRQWVDAFDDWKFEIESIRGAGDRVVVIARQWGRAKASGAEVDMRYGQIFTIRDGRGSRMDMYTDPADALRAAEIED